MKLYFFLTQLICLLFYFNPAFADKNQNFSETRILILGDSLTEGLGVAQPSAFPALLELKLNSKLKRPNHSWKIISSGVSGSTSSSAEGRLKWILSSSKNRPQMIILALGSNDGLRGFDHTETEKNLSKAIEKIQSEKIKVVLCGMAMPPNYGKKYTEEYRKIFPNLARKYKIPIVPFILEGVAGKSELNQPDGIHPNEKGHQVISENIFRTLKDVL